jgi:hypothetical protein
MYGVEWMEKTGEGTVYRRIECDSRKEAIELAERLSKNAGNHAVTIEWPQSFKGGGNNGEDWWEE